MCEDSASASWPLSPTLSACALASAAPVVVERVVDGDTIVVRGSGGRERVRLIGIDASEPVAPGGPVEPCGPEVSRRLRALLPRATRVVLVQDPSVSTSPEALRTQ